MLSFRSVSAAGVLSLFLGLAGCGPAPREPQPAAPTDPTSPVPSEPAPAGPEPGAAGTAPTEPSPAPPPPPLDPSFSLAPPFLRLRPLHVEPPRPREPDKPIFRIYYDLEGIPQHWIDEWKAGRDLKIEQHSLPLPPAEWPTQADLVIASPDRLVREHLRPYPSDAPAARANPVFLHHPFDPDQTLTRPWRWTPWVILRSLPAEGSPVAQQTPEAPPAWPDRPAMLRAWWLKSQQLSANHPVNASLQAKWQTALEAHKTQPVSELWSKLANGEVSSALLPLSWKLRQPADGVRADWTVPATGTVIHFDLLAIGLESDQPELALEWVRFLSDPQRQAQLPETTGYYPVQRPLGREIPGLPGPPPAWWDRSEFPNGNPPERKPATTALPAPSPLPDTPADVPVVVPLYKPEDIKPSGDLSTPGASR